MWKCKFFSSKKNNKTASKSLIYGAHEKIPCAPKLSVFGTVGAHDAWSCALSVFEISDFGTHPTQHYTTLKYTLVHYTTVV